jgi:hypothetical protein
MYYTQDFFEVMIAERQEQCRRASARPRATRTARRGRLTAWLRRRRGVNARPATVTALPSVAVEPASEAA